jgi:hypothetical protein
MKWQAWKQYWILTLVSATPIRDMGSVHLLWLASWGSTKCSLMLHSSRELEFFYSRGMENGCRVKMRRQLGLMEAVVPRCGKNKNVALYRRRAFILSFLRWRQLSCPRWQVWNKTGYEDGKFCMRSFSKGRHVSPTSSSLNFSTSVFFWIPFRSLAFVQSSWIVLHF